MYVTVSRNVEWTNEHNNNFTKWQRSLQTQTTKTTFLRRLKQHFPGCLRGQQIHAIYTCLSTRSHVILILICFYRATLCITRTVLSQHVWLSSFTRRYCVKTVKDILKLFLQSDSHTSIVFSVSNVMPIFRRGLPNGGVECRGMEKSRFTTNISLYAGNDTR